ncbi:MAG: MBL fold metallo-hydrolase [Phycisphaerales bacterium]
MRIPRIVLQAGSLAAAIAVTAAASGQIGRGVEIETIRVSGSVYMLVGQGGNIGVSVGDDGVFLVDDQFAPLTPLILNAIRELSDQPVRFVVNTHWHGDHTGGNENLAAEGAVIVAHENVRKRMSTTQFMAAFNRETPAAPEGALPVVTFSETITFHWNDDEVRIIHVDPAHTDGDSLVHFVGANAIHMGDLYFSTGYPFIDTSSEGSLGGVIAAVDRALELANDETKIIPGHGPLSNPEELREYRSMLDTMHGRIQALIDEGKSREEVIAAAPSASFDEEWGGGFMKPEQWVGIVYDGMTR